MPDPLAQERVIIIAAMTEIVGLDDYSSATVDTICWRAGVSQEMFFACFTSPEECFLAAFDDIVARGGLHMLSVCRELDSWRTRTRAALHALLSFLDAEPFSARLLIVESLGVSTRVLWRRSRLLDRFVDAVHVGGSSACSRPAPTRAVARGVVSTVHSVVYESVACAPAGRLALLTAPLMSLIVAPYLGEDAACEELGLGVVGG